MRFLITLTLFAVAVTAYATLVRPYLAEQAALKPYFAKADGLWARVWASAKKYWDIAAAAVLMFLPDAIELLEQLRAIDLTALLPGEVGRIVMQITGVALPLLRWLVMRARA